MGGPTASLSIVTNSVAWAALSAGDTPALPPSLGTPSMMTPGSKSCSPVPAVRGRGLPSGKGVGSWFESPALGAAVATVSHEKPFHFLFSFCISYS